MASFTGKYIGNMQSEGFMPDGTPAFHTAVPVGNAPKTELSPTDLVAAGFATCSLLVMCEYAKNHDIDIEGAHFEVTKEMYAGKPSRIGRIHVVMHVPDRDLTEKEKIGLQRAAAACPVKNSLLPELIKEMDFNWFEAD